jgi:repressor LexA
MPRRPAVPEENPGPLDSGTTTVLSPAGDAGVPEEPPKLTARQQSVLNCIQRYLRERGYPPSIREIGESVGLSSPSSVAHQRKVVQRMGYLYRDHNRPRAVELRQPGRPGVRALVSGPDHSQIRAILVKGLGHARAAGSLPLHGETT